MKKSPTTDQMKTWLAILVRGMTLRSPEAMQIRPHKSWLLVRAGFPAPKGSEEGTPGQFVELVISNCRNMNYTPLSEISFANFNGEWPPYSMMKELDRPRLVTLNGENIE